VWARVFSTGASRKKAAGQLERAIFDLPLSSPISLHFPRSRVVGVFKQGVLTGPGNQVDEGRCV